MIIGLLLRNLIRLISINSSSTFRGIMKKSFLLLYPIAVSLILLISQNNISFDFFKLPHNKVTNNNILSTYCGIDNNQSIHNNEAKYLLKLISERYFSLICHQHRPILICINGDNIPLCPRCMGLHMGFLITFLILTIFTKGIIRVSSSSSLMILLVGLSMTGMEWGLAQFSIIRSTDISRMFTGLVTGSVFGILIMIYKGKCTLTGSSGHLPMSVYQIIGLISISIAGVMIMMLSNSWMLIDLTLLISVTANFIIIIHIIILRLTPFMKFLTIKNEIP